MKIAVCFSGQIRTGVEASPSILRFIGELLPYVDFFIHSWDTETISHHALNGRDESSSYKVFDVNPDKIKKIKEIYKPKSIKIDNVKEYCKNREAKIRKENNDLVASLIPMFHSIFECNELKIKYETQNNFKYDYVIRMRFDTVFDENHKLSDEIEHCSKDKNTLYVCDYWNKLPNQLEDILWIASSDNMDIMCNFLIDRETLSEYISVDWQIHSKIYLDKHKIRINGFKTNKLYIYRDYHLEQNISPFNTELL